MLDKDGQIVNCMKQGDRFYGNAQTQDFQVAPRYEEITTS